MALEDLDELDRRIIEMMCSSSQGSYRQLAKQLGVHPTTLIQRVKALEKKGIIRGYRAKIDYVAMGYDFVGVVMVKADDPLAAGEAIATVPEVVSVREITGDENLMVEIACVDRSGFSAAVRAISAVKGVKKAASIVFLGEVKHADDFVPPLLEDGPSERRGTIYTAFL